MLLLIARKSSAIAPCWWADDGAAVAAFGSCSRIVTHSSQSRPVAHAALLSITVISASFYSLRLSRLLEQIEQHHGVWIGPVFLRFLPFIPRERATLFAPAGYHCDDSHVQLQNTNGRFAALVLLVAKDFLQTRHFLKREGVFFFWGNHASQGAKPMVVLARCVRNVRVSFRMPAVPSSGSRARCAHGI